MVRIRTDITQMENKGYKGSMKQFLFENINRINKILSKTNQKRKKDINNEIRDKEVDIITDSNEIQKVIGHYFENFTLIN
jgi:transcription antitermination factor NusA-like protein